MIQLGEKLWVGNSDDAYKVRSGAILNVAVDHPGAHNYPNVEHAHVGLINGPGNELADYAACVLTLKMLMRRSDNVLVYDHDGVVAFVVALMYLNLRGGQERASHMAWSHWPTWREALGRIAVRISAAPPEVHAAHREAFNRMKWSVIEVL